MVGWLECDVACLIPCSTPFAYRAYALNSHHRHEPFARRSISKMDVLKAVQTYVNKMITEVSGMKVLLLDSHTVCLGPLTAIAVHDC